MPRPDFPEISEEVAKAAFPIAFPEFEARRQIGQALTILHDEGIHGREEAVTLLREVLGSSS